MSCNKMNLDLIAPQLLRDGMDFYKTLMLIYPNMDFASIQTSKCVSTYVPQQDCKDKKEKVYTSKLKSNEVVFNATFGADDLTITIIFMKSSSGTIQPVITILYDTVLVGKSNIENERKRILKCMKVWLENSVQSYNRVVKRCLAIKEELMSVCWHPSRIQKALSSGMDVEDM